MNSYLFLPRDGCYRTGINGVFNVFRGVGRLVDDFGLAIIIKFKNLGAKGNAGSAANAGVFVNDQFCHKFLE